MPPVGDIADGLDSTYQRALCIVERGGDNPYRCPLAVVKERACCFGNQGSSVPFQVGIFCLKSRIFMENEVDENRLPVMVTRDRIFIIPFSQHFGGSDPG